MRHALGLTIVVLLTLPAAAQDQPSSAPSPGPPAAEPSAPAEAGNPGGDRPSSDNDTSADFEAPPASIKPVVATDAQKSICLLIESAAHTNGLPVEFFA